MLHYNCCDKRLQLLGSSETQPHSIVPELPRLEGGAMSRLMMSPEPMEAALIAGAAGRMLQPSRVRAPRCLQRIRCGRQAD